MVVVVMFIMRISVMGGHVQSTGLCRSSKHRSCSEFRQLVFFFVPVIFFGLRHAVTE